jgi:hypothetical protein
VGYVGFFGGGDGYDGFGVVNCDESKGVISFRFVPFSVLL